MIFRSIFSNIGGYLRNMYMKPEYTFNEHIDEMIEKEFRLHDMNADGFIDKNECYIMVLKIFLLVAGYTSISYYTVPQHDYFNNLFNSLDTRHENNINLKEFKILLKHFIPDISYRIGLQLIFFKIIFFFVGHWVFNTIWQHFGNADTWSGFIKMNLDFVFETIFRGYFPWIRSTIEDHLLSKINGSWITTILLSELLFPFISRCYQSLYSKQIVKGYNREIFQRRQAKEARRRDDELDTADLSRMTSYASSISSSDFSMESKSIRKRRSPSVENLNRKQRRDPKNFSKRNDEVEINK